MSNDNPSRSAFFQQLKPCCVSINQLAIKPSQDAGSSRKLSVLVAELLSIIEGQLQRDPSVMDEKLAEYIFFPLSHIFRYQESHPMSLIEVTLKCLIILVNYGWKTKISPELVQQLLVLLTFIAGGVPGRNSTRETSEEVTLESFRALDALFKASGSSTSAAAALVAPGTIPALGHCVTVILDGFVDGKSVAIQIECLQCIQTLQATIKDDAALATLLPGTVSSITKFLSAPGRSKSRVVVSAIETLRSVIVRVLGDLMVRSILVDKSETIPEKKVEKSSEGKVLTPAWLKATTSQIKVALASILKLQSHKSDEVLKALDRFCVALLDECNASLSDCTLMLVETATALTSEDRGMFVSETSLHDLCVLYPELTEVVKTVIYNWVGSLPRVMQSSDEETKGRAIRNLLNGLSLASQLQIDSITLQDSMASALRDTMTQVILTSKTDMVRDQILAADMLAGGSDMVTGGPRLPPPFPPVLMAHESQVQTRKEMTTLIAKIGSPALQTKLAEELLDYVQESNGASQVASYWLAFELLKAAFRGDQELDSFLNLDALSSSGSRPEDVFHELYSYSVSILDSHSETGASEWQLEAVALEVTVFAANRAGISFRPELIDVLYPIATLLGSNQVQLQHHAVVALNSLASSCEYDSVSQLIIDNVDYMVNSVSLRLNTFDITPTSTKVLTMMVRLTGPRLIPFLDDVVASVFSALENYHGYPAFVEALFGVLREIVDQGVKSEVPLLEGAGPRKDHTKQPRKGTTMDDLLDTVKCRKQRQKETEAELEVFADERGHPKKPWKSPETQTKGRIMEILDEDDDLPESSGDNDSSRQDEGEGEGEGEMDVEEKKVIHSPTYTLLTKVAYLTQYYLTSPAPSLRRSLLDLIQKVAPALSSDEVAFLPLINAIWPVVTSRLYDGESFVAIAACDTLQMLCSTAGDFLSSRFKTEWWGKLDKRCQTIKLEAEKSSKRRGDGTGASNKAIDGPGMVQSDIRVPVGGGKILKIRTKDNTSLEGGGLGRFGQPIRLWRAMVGLLTAIVSYVRIEDEMYDEILDLLIDEVPRNEGVRTALETVNPDAVWLALYERGRVQIQPTPKVEGFIFAEMKMMS